MLTLHVLPDALVVCRLDPADAPPSLAPFHGPFVSLTRTADEVSLVCATDDAPDGATVEGGWRALRVAGTLSFALVGVLASLATPLAEAGISVFVVSTFDTDYVLVRETTLDLAVAALTAAGHTVV